MQKSEPQKPLKGLCKDRVAEKRVAKRRKTRCVWKEPRARAGGVTSARVGVPLLYLSSPAYLSLYLSVYQSLHLRIFWDPHSIYLFISLALSLSLSLSLSI